jgi:hypothetical protein
MMRLMDGRSVASRMATEGLVFLQLSCKVLAPGPAGQEGRGEDAGQRPRAFEPREPPLQPATHASFRPITALAFRQSRGFPPTRSRGAWRGAGE